MIKPLKFWCQHVLPLVYDDSLSYYELLSKVTEKINEIIPVVNVMDEVIQEDVEKVIKEMKDDGTLADIINQQLFSEINSKIDNNAFYVTPEAYGAKGDGRNDDTAAIQNAIINANGRPVKLSKKYKISETIHVYADCTPELDMNGCYISAMSAMSQMFIVGEHLSGQSTGYFAQKQTIKNGIINAELATDCIVIHTELLRCLIDNIVILNVVGSGIKAGRVISGENTRKYQFNEVFISGANVPNGDIMSIGIELNCWDCILSNISTFYVYKGIYTIGGAIITNHHHWTGIDNYSTPDIYNGSCAVHSLNVVQITNLYDDSGISVLTTGGAVIATNIKKESNTGAYRRPGYVLTMIKAINSNVRIDLGEYSWTSESNENVKCITIDTPLSDATITSIFKSASHLPMTGTIVDQANDISNKQGLHIPLWLKSDGSAAWDANKYYLIGYINNYGNTWSLYSLTIIKGDISSSVVFDKQGESVHDHTNNTELLGTLVFGRGEVINGLKVVPVYIKPNSSQLGTSWRFMSLKLNYVNGNCGFYPKIANSASEFIGIDSVTEIGRVAI